MDTTTERIYVNDIQTIKRWKKKLGIKSFAELIHLWIENVQMHKRSEFYSKLTTRDDHLKRLSGCRIDKKNICIQN